MVGFLLVGVIFKILCIFIRIIEGFMLQSADKFLKAVCQMGNFIVIFLIHMDYRRLSLRAASPVVQEIISCPALGQSQMATPMAGYSHSAIINWLPSSPQREQLFSRPIPKMPVMAT